MVKSAHGCSTIYKRYISMEKEISLFKPKIYLFIVK